MKVKVLCLLLFIVAGFSNVAYAKDQSTKQTTKTVKKKAPKKVKLKSSQDSVSFAMGISVGTDVLNVLTRVADDQYSKKVFLDAFTQVIQEDSTMILKEQADSIVKDFLAKKELKYEKENKDFLVENAKKDSVVALPSGLQYKIIEQGSGIKPTATDVVQVHYEGKLINGTLFDSSLERGESIEFRLDRVIKGWTEGLQLMPEGSKYILYIPAEMGYGRQPVGSIPANSTLIFEVQLIKVKK